MRERNNDSALVSVIIPIYNQERYLDKSIQSIIEQDYKNIEIIAVEDGSTDKSFEILKKYRTKDSRIHIVKKKNGGLVDAVVHGVKRAKGDYICFLDPDDYVGKSYISFFLNNINETDVIAAGYYRNSEEGISKNFLKSDACYSKEKRYDRNNLILNKSEGQVSSDFFVARWNKMYRGEVVKKIIDEYAEYRNISFGEDSIFTYLVLCNSTNLKTVRDVNKYYYNIKSQTSMMSNTSIEMHLKKSEETFKSFSSLLLRYGDSKDNAYFLYFFLNETLFQRVKKGNKEEFINLYKTLHKNTTYINALNKLINISRGRRKFIYLIRKKVKSGKIYLSLTRVNF